MATEEKLQAEKKKKKKKPKYLRVWNWGFFFSLCIIALVTFYAFFMVGVNMSDHLPF